MTTKPTNTAFITPIFPSVGRIMPPSRRTTPTMGTSLSKRTKLAKMVQQETHAHGPHCPLINPTLLQYCLLCAREVQKPGREKERQDAVVEKLLKEARAAIGGAKRGVAERCFLKALVVDPGCTKTYFLYALQVQRRDPGLARELFKMGLKEDPLDAGILQAWGLFESKQGKLGRAQRLLKRSVYLEPLNAPVLKWKILFPETRNSTNDSDDNKSFEVQSN